MADAHALLRAAKYEYEGGTFTRARQAEFFVAMEEALNEYETESPAPEPEPPPAVKGAKK